MSKNKNIVITGLGMVSAVGRDVVTSCASARAGITRSTDLDIEILDEESLSMEALKGHVVKGFTDGFDGLGRLVRLGATALGDLLNYGGLSSKLESETGFFLHLDGDYYEDVFFENEVKNINKKSYFLKEEAQFRLQAQERNRIEITNALISRLAEFNNISIPKRSHYYSFGDPAMFLELLTQAMECLERKDFDICILGGIASLVDKQTTEVLSNLNLIKSSESESGFSPGEAAAFILLEHEGAARLRGAKIEAVIEYPAVIKESFHRFSKESHPNGQALFKAISAAFEQFESKPEGGLAITNLNGDNWRAQDFGNAIVRMVAAGLPSNFAQWHPASSFGEIGAATGPAAICLGVRGFVRKYAPSRDILIALSSDGETRGAFFLRKANVL